MKKTIIIAFALLWGIYAANAQPFAASGQVTTNVKCYGDKTGVITLTASGSMQYGYAVVPKWRHMRCPSMR